MNRLRISKLLGKSKRKKSTVNAIEYSEQDVQAVTVNTNKHENISTSASKQEDTAPKEHDADEDESVMREHDKVEMAFYERMRENAESLLRAEKEAEDESPQDQDDAEDVNVEAWLEKAAVAAIVDIVLGDFRGRHNETRQLEIFVSSILGHFHDHTGISAVSLIPDEKNIDVATPININDLVRSFQAAFKASGRYKPVNLRKEQYNTDEAISCHLKYTLNYLMHVGSFGSFKIKELISLHRLANQGRILQVIVEAEDKDGLKLDDFPELVKRRNLLEFWRSCSDGEDRLSVNVKIVCLEFESEFGREIRRKHPDVAYKIFPELVNRILGQNVDEMAKHTMTIFQLLQFLQEMTVDGEIEDLSKTIDKLALEMFLTSALRSGNDDLILVAIKRVGTLLALRLSNLCALSHLLLSKENAIRSSAANRIIQIAKDISLREKAVASFAELLESTAKRDRQCACLALGLLKGTECIPQLAYLYHGDVEMEVRDAAAHALVIFGDEGKLALEHAASTLLVQTNTQLVSSKSRMRLGTAL